MRIILLMMACFSMQAVMAQTTTLSNKAYSIKYPADWIEEPGTNAQQFTIKAPADTGAVDNFVENLNMVVNEVPGYDAKGYAQFSIGYMPQKVKQFVVIENKKGSFAGKDSWYIVFKGVQFGKKLQWKQYYIMKGTKVYILTFTGEASRYKQYSKAVDAMMMSFVVK